MLDEINAGILNFNHELIEKRGDIYRYFKAHMINLQKFVLYGIKGFYLTVLENLSRKID